jgi:hypothetical protein
MRMQTATIFHQFAAVQSARINATDGVIYGVSLITEGPALGHGVYIDAKTLEQVQAAASTYSGGLKVKMNHGGGAGDIVGFIDNLRIAGPKLLGDFHLLQSSEHRQYILEIATKIPDTFGLSIAFSGPSELGADKRAMQRCTEIYSVDLVSEPAANPDGLFSRKKLETTTEESSAEIKIELPMNEEMKAAIAEMIQSALTDMGQRMAKLEGAMPPAVDPKAIAASSQIDAVQLAAKEGALNALKEFSKTFGAPPAPATPAPAPAPVVTDDKFEQFVAKKTADLKGDKAAAISFCIKNHATEYVAYRARVASGEVVKL